MTLQNAAETVVKVAERLGVTVVILAALLWMIREAATSMHNTVVVPIISSHTEFLRSTQQNLDEIAKVQTKQADTLRELAIGQNEIRHAVLSSGTSR